MNPSLLFKALEGAELSLKLFKKEFEKYLQEEKILSERNPQELDKIPKKTRTIY